MKKIGLILMTLLFVAALMVGGTQAHENGFSHQGYGHEYSQQGFGHGFSNRGFEHGMHFRGPAYMRHRMHHYGFFSFPPVITQPPIYVQPPLDDAFYGYICENPKGYYPYVTNCPSGWLEAVPDPDD